MATKFYNKPTIKEFRKSLRANMTKSERVLWSRLRRNQMLYKFRRQYSIGNYFDSQDVFKRIKQVEEQIYLLCQELGGFTPS